MSLTDILIRGRQTNSQVIVSGVPSRREKKIGTPDRRLGIASALGAKNSVSNLTQYKLFIGDDKKMRFLD